MKNDCLRKLVKLKLVFTLSIALALGGVPVQAMAEVAGIDVAANNPQVVVVDDSNVGYNADSEDQLAPLEPEAVIDSSDSGEDEDSEIKQIAKDAGESGHVTTAEPNEEPEEMVSRETPFPAVRSVSVADPRVVVDSSMNAGQVTTWDCIWLGSYPQTYVDDTTVVAALDTANGWDASGDLTYDGTTYRRLSVSDATIDLHEWGWDTKASSAGYCYFRWEPVKWRVLEAYDTTALVVADVALDDQKYNNTSADLSWATCTMRGWLNSKFLSDCFTPAQQLAVIEHTLQNADNSSYGTSGGEDTIDSVYLLAELDVMCDSGGPMSSQCKRHGFRWDSAINDEARRCKTSDYAQAMGVSIGTSSDNFGNCIWWLRTPGYDTSTTKCVNTVGSTDRNCYSVVNPHFGTRPALIISLDSEQVSFAGTVSSNGAMDEQPAPYTGEKGSGASTADVSGKCLSEFSSGTLDLWFDSSISRAARVADGRTIKALVPVSLAWDDAWFKGESSTYNHQLATAASVLAAAVYEDTATIPDGCEVDVTNLARFNLKKLGFDENTFDSYYPHLESDYTDPDSAFSDYGIDQVGCFVGIKWLDGGDTPLVAILVRGTTGNIEWVSNFNIADSDVESTEHEGMDRASQMLCEWLGYYADDIEQRYGIDLSDAVFLVTGHSRGAGVSNLLAKRLDDGSPAFLKGIGAKGRTYCYTFASPNVSRSSAIRDVSAYGNIFNIVNPEDTITRLALSEWGYGRYGATCVLPSKSLTWSYFRKHLEMKPIFMRMTGREHSQFLLGAATSREFASALSKAVPSVSAAYRPIDKRSGIEPIDILHDLGYVLGPQDMGPILQDVNILSSTHPELTFALKRLLINRPDVVVRTAYPSTLISSADIAPAIRHAHTPETYIAWMLSANGSELYSPFYYGVHIACPVDVKVYDSEGTLVCSIQDNEVDEGVMENGLAAYVHEGVKHIDVPGDGQYRFEIIATDDGEMDISVELRNAEDVVSEQVAYAGLLLTNGEGYAVDIVGGSESVVDAAIVTEPSGKVVKPAHVSSSKDVGSISISVSADSSNGSVSGQATASWGDPVVVVATPEKGFNFLGWYENDLLVSRDEAYLFRAEVDRTLIAKFGKAEIEWRRLWGNSSLDTAAAIVSEGWEDGCGGTVVVARNDDFKDALAGAGLAGLMDAPIVLTNGKALSLQAKEQLVRLRPSRVYVAGGKGAVSDTVVNGIARATGLQVMKDNSQSTAGIIRLWGSGSSQTSAELARAGAGQWADTAVIATNKSFKDALSSAPICYAMHYPILLASSGRELAPEVLSALSELGIRRVYIMGGTEAVKPYVELQLRAANIGVAGRKAGSCGWETSCAIANWGLELGLSVDCMGYATSQKFPDALAGAALLGKKGSVLLLADQKAQGNLQFAKDHADEITRGYVFGGTGAFSQHCYDQLP